MYEIVFRAREGLPLPCRKLIEILLKSAIARTQRDGKVILCHFVWMGNHVHILVVARDALKLTQFYGELQKRITDYMKALLGLGHLDLWEGRASVIYIADQEAAMERVVYLYTNPARAALVESITDYPGYSSWSAFTSINNTPNARHSERVPWFRATALPKAPSRDLTDSQENRIIAHLSSNITTHHRIQLMPNAWMRAFGIRDSSEVAEINHKILKRIEFQENELRQRRALQFRKCVGKNRLITQPLMCSHMPKKRSRRIFVIARIKKVRMEIISLFKSISQLCRERYQLWCGGDFSLGWPPGTFPPPIVPLANAIG